MHRLEFHAKSVAHDQSRQWKKPNRSPRVVSSGVLSAVGIAAVVFTISPGPTNKSINEVVRQTGVGKSEAARAIELAILTNVRGQLILKEAIDKANAIKAAEATDPAASPKIKSIAFTAVGGETRAVISPAVLGVSVQYTVSGTDGYYKSTRLQTDAEGRVFFTIPPAIHGVLDAISVSVLLNGKTAKTTYTW